nr:hypothetical protein [Tanacetum cinerariifolium]
DKMKEKGDLCILVGYSTQSKGYRVYNKKIKLIVKSIQIRFDEIKEMSEMSVANDTSGLVPLRQKASAYDNPLDSIHIRFDEIKEVSEASVANDTSSLVPQRQKVSDFENSDPVPQLHSFSSSADAHVPSQQELDLLFGPLYDEFFNAGSNLKDTQPTTNIQPTSAPSTPTYVVHKVHK